MHSVLSSTAVLLSVLATSALAAPQDSSATTTADASSSTASGVHSVQVGPGLSFTPDTVTAAQGDWVEFTFGSGHSVAQSSFDAPCVPLSGGAGVYSGFPNDGDVWRFQVNSTDPIWLYCSKTGHCQGGMALVVNPPSEGNTLDAYKTAATDTTEVSPDNVQGGVFGAASDSSSSSGSSGSSTSGSDSSSTSSGGSSATQSSSATSSGSGSSSNTASSSGSAASASSTGNGASSNVVRSGMMFAGAVAAGVAAVL